MSLRWSWGRAASSEAEHDGRRCVRLDTGLDGPALATVEDVELEDGAFEVELCVPPARSFHGIVWRVQGDREYESFFVRPHQVGTGRLGVLRSISDPVPESSLPDPELGTVLRGRTWSALDAEPSGLVDLARAQGSRAIATRCSRER